MINTPLIAVVIPCYKVRDHILNVIQQIGPEVCQIYIIDDCCPDHSGDFVEQHCHDKRINIIRNPTNLGVGGAVMQGYKSAIAAGIDIIVKIDGDDQMDASLIPDFIAPILSGEADYTKGNRFFNLEELYHMPKIRLFGNGILSFMTKFSSGYWDLFDPTNGYTAIHCEVAQHLPFKKISSGYFFESDMLFRLNTLRAVVLDIPIDAKYGKEISHLKISSIIGEFTFKHMRNFYKRIFYNYYLRDMSLASFELPIGIFLIFLGTSVGIYKWIYALKAGIATPAGTVMLVALPIIIGMQFIFSFIGHDIASVPKKPLHKRSLRHSFPFKK